MPEKLPFFKQDDSFSQEKPSKAVTEGSEDDFDFVPLAFTHLPKPKEQVTDASLGSVDG